MSQTFPGAGKVNKNVNNPRTPSASIQTTSTHGHPEERALPARKWSLAQLWVFISLTQTTAYLHKPFVQLPTTFALCDNNPSQPRPGAPAAEEGREREGGRKRKKGREREKRKEGKRRRGRWREREGKKGRRREREKRREREMRGRERERIICYTV